MFKSIEAIKDSNDLMLKENAELNIEEIRWQHNLCVAHADFNNYKSPCPVSSEDCLVNVIMGCNCELTKIREKTIGHNITVGEVMDVYFEDGGNITTLIKRPAWLVCLAEYLTKQKG